VRDLLPRGERIEPRLAGAVADTLSTPGSLWRAQLAFAVARACALSEPDAEALATGVEAFHTASILFDDLPSMDDAATRRGRPCAHRAHGEAAAQLAALGFVHRGYARFWRAFEAAAVLDRRAAAALVEECLGLTGILDGQARDVAFGTGEVSPAEVVRVARGKSVTLLRLALELPAIVAGAPAEVRERLAALADAWGLAYQVLDDLEETTRPDGTDARLGRPNLALVAGRAAAEARVDAELVRAHALVAALAATLPALRAPFVRLSFRLAGLRAAVAPPAGRA
jgi:geranylgeranyl pyrophosphate synthase